MNPQGQRPGARAPTFYATARLHTCILLLAPHHREWPNLDLPESD